MLAGWTGWGGQLLHPSVYYCICLKSVYLRRGRQQIPHLAPHLPAIHRPWRSREESTACFVFSPLRRGVSHQLALDRPGSRGSGINEQCGLLT